MLSVSSLNYYVPVKANNVQGSVGWLLYRKDSDEITFARQFNYTVVDGTRRATFSYDGKSVKPSPRTLRIFGAQRTGDCVSYLSQNVELAQQLTFRD
jgi:hypothetical protein